MDTMGIGIRIQEIREAKNMTQEKLAECVGVSLQTIGNIENGRRGMKMTTFIEICCALEASADYILFGKR